MTLRALRQSTRMSKITNDGLTRSDTDHWRKGFVDSDSHGMQLSCPGLAAAPELFASWCSTDYWFTAGLLYVSNTNFQRLQRVQNAAARIVCQAPRRQHHSVDLLSSLVTCAWQSWLKDAVLCYKAVKLQQPSYLTGLLSSYRESRVLRSSTSDLGLLSTQSPSTNIAGRRFTCCAPTFWNSLPSFVRTADSFTSFRSQLKTFVAGLL